MDRSQLSLARLVPALLVTALVVVLLVAPAAAQEEEEEEPLGWSLAGEVSLVLAQGNTESTTAGVKLDLVHDWADAAFELGAGGLQAENTTTTRRAVGVPGDFEIVETSDTETTAESSYLRGRYQHDVTERFFWFAGAGWERNQLAGFDSRLSVRAGVGNQWWKTKRSRFRTDYSLTYTEQDDVIDDPSTADGFLGARVSYAYWRKLTDTTTFASELGIDGNLDDTQDLRADFVNSVAVEINDWMALKVSLELLYDNQPALTEIPLTTPAGLPTGNVLVELEELDSIFTAALVLTR